MATKKGKLIVIDGSDGVGKATQTKLLVERLKKEGKKVVTLDFPRYEQNFFGAFVGACLRGDHGDFLHLDPYIASVFYAADRFESKKVIEDALNSGAVVVLDRYVSANQMHQGGKIKEVKKRKEFLKWLDTMEHKVFGIPRPDLIVYLHLPVTLSLLLLRTKAANDKKKYLKGKWDTVENDMRYLANAQKSALKIIQAGARWCKIVCNKGNTILPREVIHENIWTVVKKSL
jgi:thymidylate kinase